MTEPAPGAGSDPAALLTTAVKDGNHYVINGDKWFITGADGAAFAIIMAKDEDGHATMFLADMDTPGIEIVRAMDSLDSAFAGGHAVMRFNNVRVPAGDILGEPGKGFRYAQVRLAPARLTHCMRWLGAAKRAHQIATDYALKREVFGAKLIGHEGVGFMLADNEIDIRMSRLSICTPPGCWIRGARRHRVLDGERCSCRRRSGASSIVACKVLGGQGVTGETLVARIFNEVRGFRIYDGPSEVHRWSLAQRTSDPSGAMTSGSGESVVVAACVIVLRSITTLCRLSPPAVADEPVASPAGLADDPTGGPVSAYGGPLRLRRK
jgi:acyl-CoA dehydrogenase